MSDKIDFDRISKLCTIVEQISKVAPGYVSISGEAMAELRQIDEDIRKAKLADQDLPITPAPVGDEDSPAQPIPPGGSEGDFDTHPLASQPLEEIDGPKAIPADNPTEIGAGSATTADSVRRI